MNPTPRRRPSPALAALASALLPGLGQAMLGAWRSATLLLIFDLLLLTGLAAALLTAPSPAFLAGELLQPTVLLGLLSINLLLLGLRLLAGASAWRAARRRSGRTPMTLVLVLIALLVVGPQLGAAALLWRTYDTVTTIFAPSPDLGLASPNPSEPLPSALPTLPPTPQETPAPTPVPTPTPDWASRGRLNLLLVGADAGPGRWSLRSDTMILLSVDVASGRAAMFGLPRNLINVPLPPQWAHLWPCGCYPDLLNSLYVFASAYPGSFGGGPDVGFKVLETTVAYFTGVPIDGTAVVTLNGFVALVDALGGLEINIPNTLFDANYPDESGQRNITVSFAPGWQHLSGHFALAYARSRHQDSDYGRMARQQLVLRALQSQLEPCILVSRIPELLDLAKANFWTDLPVSQLPDLFALADRTDAAGISSVTFVPPRYPEYITASETNTIRGIVADVFNEPAPAPTPTPTLPHWYQDMGDASPAPNSGC